MEYRANFTTRSCEKRFLNDTFRPFSIPFDAKYIDTVEIGSNLAPGDGVEVYVWGGQTPGKPHSSDQLWENWQLFGIFFVL